MNNLIIDATNDKIFLMLINNDKNIYSASHENIKTNYEKLTILISDFLKNHDLKINKISKLYVNRGPGSFAGIRNSLAVVKAIFVAKKIVADDGDARAEEHPRGHVEEEAHPPFCRIPLAVDPDRAEDHADEEHCHRELVFPELVLGRLGLGDRRDHEHEREPEPERVREVIGIPRIICVFEARDRQRVDDAADRDEEHGHEDAEELLDVVALEEPRQLDLGRVHRIPSLLAVFALFPFAVENDLDRRVGVDQLVPSGAQRG